MSGLANAILEGEAAMSERTAKPEESAPIALAPRPNS